ncbi:hypothetical protein E4T42_09716 [Aureobasidium subglaciale]|nr:hypothetical protein E4T42_09716 [Aureobasidium subglaciale]
MATQEAPWRLARKAVLVHAPDLDNVGCLAHVNISYNKMQQEGYIAIKVNLRLAGSNNEHQTIHLNILPRTINACSVTSSSYKNLLPNKLLTKLHGAKEASDATTLSLNLKEPGIILVPPGLSESISPADPRDDDFYAMSQISQATSIRLHYIKQDLPRDGKLRLQTFASALNKHALSAPIMNYNHLNAGIGAHERNWTVFDQPPPIPTYNQVILPSTILGKRSRGQDAAPDMISRTPCSSPPPWSPTEVCSSFEVDVPTEAGVLAGASTGLAIETPIKARQLARHDFPTGSELHETQSTSTIASPARSIKSRHSQSLSPSNIVPTVFNRGCSKPDVVTAPPRYQKKCSEQVPYVEETFDVDDNALKATARGIIQDVVDKEKQSILTEHQEMCDEAEFQIAEAIDDGRLAIIEKTDECCDEICQKIQEACEESCEMLQADVACLVEASIILKKTLAKLSSASDTAALTSGRLECRLTHPSTLAAQIITDHFEDLAIPDKVTMLTKVADTGFANVFLAVNHELRKELVSAWTKPMREN